MVESNAASGPGSAPAPPSFGPSSIPYVPPITLDDAIVHARVTLRRREKRGGRLVIGSVVALTIPLIDAFTWMFPANVYATVPASAYGLAAAVIALYLFLIWAAYRILTDRPGIIWAVLPVAGAMLAVSAYLLWNVVLAYVNAVAAGTANPYGLVLSLAGPICLALGGACALAGALGARPRAVAPSMAG